MSLLSSLSSLDVCLTGLITSPSQLVSAAFSMKILKLHLNVTGASLNSHSQFSCSVVYDSLRPHRLHYARPPCPTSAPRAYSNSYPLSQWCHPTISSSVIPFSSHLQSFQHPGLFQWVSSSHQVAKVLEFQLQHQSFQWTLRTDLP